MMAKKKKDATFSMDSDSPADERSAKDGERADELAEAYEEHTGKGNTRKAIEGARRKSMEAVGTEADLTDLEDAVRPDGITEEEAGGQLERMLREADGVEPEEIDTLPAEERQELKERAEESGSIEDVAEFLEAQLDAAEAQGAEGGPGQDAVPWADIQEATGVSPHDVTVRAKVDGEEMDLSLGEAVAGYQREATFTKKTTELARERDSLREDAERLSQQYDALGLALQQAGVGEQQLQAIEQQYQQARDLQEQYTEDQVRQAAEEGMEEVRSEFGWKSESDWSVAAAQLATTAEKLGFTPEEYVDVVDARYIKLLEYARRGLEADSGRKDPAPLKPGQGSRNPATRRRERTPKDVREARKRLARTGSATDAAKALEGILGDEI